MFPHTELFEDFLSRSVEAGGSMILPCLLRSLTSNLFESWILIIRRPGDCVDPAHVGGDEAGVPHQRRGEGPAARDRGHGSVVKSLENIILNVFKYFPVRPLSFADIEGGLYLLVAGLVVSTLVHCTMIAQIKLLNRNSRK